MKSPKAFGELFKKRRMDLGLTLREFCRKHDLDPGNVSRMERGLLPPPASEKKLTGYAKMMHIETGSADWKVFIDLARICAGRIPDDIMADEYLVGCLPALFGIMHGDRVTKTPLEKLVKGRVWKT